MFPSPSDSQFDYNFSIVDRDGQALHSPLDSSYRNRRGLTVITPPHLTTVGHHDGTSQRHASTLLDNPSALSSPGNYGGLGSHLSPHLSRSYTPFPHDRPSDNVLVGDFTVGQPPHALSDGFQNLTLYQTPGQHNSAPQPSSESAISYRPYAPLVSDRTGSNHDSVHAEYSADDSPYVSASSSDLSHPFESDTSPFSQSSHHYPLQRIYGALDELHSAYTDGDTLRVPPTPGGDSPSSVSSVSEFNDGAMSPHIPAPLPEHGSAAFALYPLSTFRDTLDVPRGQIYGSSSPRSATSDFSGASLCPCMSEMLNLPGDMTDFQDRSSISEDSSHVQHSAPSLSPSVPIINNAFLSVFNPAPDEWTVQAGHTRQRAHSAQGLVSHTTRSAHGLDSFRSAPSSPRPPTYTHAPATVPGSQISVGDGLQTSPGFGHPSASSSSSLQPRAVVASDKVFTANHKRRTHKAKFFCRGCGQSFTRKASLHRHDNSHSGQRKYACTKCLHRFVNRDDCKRHLICVHHIGTRSYEDL